MNSNRPVLHISIYYRGSSKIKTTLKRQLSTYIKRSSSNPDEPSVDICLDTFDEQEEKQVLQELTYDTVVTYHTKQTLSTDQELYTIVVLLISLTMQRLYENNPRFNPEDWMLISVIPSNTDTQANNDFDIQWSTGQ
ncbi:MAG TPA: hypothetical protein PK910_09170 [Bacteroidales bacterium]|jgi:hypothetical protein|nr:MAG: hypothetical protein CV087_10615 [Candidatus Brocadia sp. WS118]HRC90172.1 hypothetical protein [Bacteroidales bacterium]